jgi:predicted amidohydrolase
MGGSNLSEKWEAVQEILNASILGQRIAIAVSYMERRWEHVAQPLRFGLGRAQELRQQFIANCRDVPSSVPAVDARALEWLADHVTNPADQQDDVVLAFLYVVDELLLPLARRKVAGALEGNYALANDEAVHLWVAESGVVRLLDPDGDRPPRVNQNQSNEFAIEELLRCVRYVLTTKADRPFDVEWIDDEVRRRFDELWNGEAFRGPLRVALYSLHGTRPRLAYTRTDSTIETKPQYFFRANEITPLDEYRKRIQTAIRDATDRKTGAEIVVFPEFMMTRKGVDTLIEVLREEAGTERWDNLPLLIFAGSSHVPQSDGGPYGNCCTVFDRSGRPVWEQWKRVPFGTHKDDRKLRRLIEDLPEEAAGEIDIHEDIEPCGSYKIRCTPIGSFAVAICSDMMVMRKRSTASVWASVPVDWVVIPSYTPETDRFLSTALTLNAGRKIVLFVNGCEILNELDPEDKKKEGWSTAPRVFSPREIGWQPVFSSFVSTPWTRPLGMWFGNGVQFTTEGPVFWSREGDGLVVDVALFLHS